MSPHFIADRERVKTGQHYIAEMLRSWTSTVDEVEDGMFPDFDNDCVRKSGYVDLAVGIAVSQA